VVGATSSEGCPIAAAAADGDADDGSLCSAGVGRTGVFVTLSIVLERMRYEGVVDMFQTVKILRTQRPAMVQNEVSANVSLWHVLNIRGRGQVIFSELSG